MPEGIGYKKPRFNTKGKQVKRKPGITMKSSGRARPGEKTPTVNKKAGKRVKIVPGFKGLIKERKKLIN